MTDSENVLVTITHTSTKSEYADIVVGTTTCAKNSLCKKKKRHWR